MKMIKWPNDHQLREWAFMSDSSALEGAYRSLRIHSDEGFPFTNESPPLKVNNFLSIKSCTFSLKIYTPRSSAPLPHNDIHTWHSSCTKEEMYISGSGLSRNHNWVLDQMKPQLNVYHWKWVKMMGLSLSVIPWPTLVSILYLVSLTLLGDKQRLLGRMP